MYWDSVGHMCKDRKCVNIIFLNQLDICENIMLEMSVENVSNSRATLVRSADNSGIAKATLKAH